VRTVLCRTVANTLSMGSSCASAPSAQLGGRRRSAVTRDPTGHRRSNLCASALPFISLLKELANAFRPKALSDAADGRIALICDAVDEAQRVQGLKGICQGAFLPPSVRNQHSMIDLRGLTNDNQQGYPRPGIATRSSCGLNFLAIRPGICELWCDSPADFSINKSMKV
jgi:hypothetical protein